MKNVRVAVIGVGSFGKNHVRVLKTIEAVELAGVVDVNLDRAQEIAREFGCPAFATTEEILGQIDAAIVAAPTVAHEEIVTELLEHGVDVLVEKPIADSSLGGERLATLAKERSQILQAGHLERFNPAVLALEQAVTVPLFFEVHRLSVFAPRSLDIDVVLDLMIHDLDIVLSLTKDMPNEIRAAGISVLSPKVDIANVRLSFASGCVANLTASRVSTEKVRKLRLFQPGEYISLDYARQDAIRLAISGNEPAIGFVPLKVEHGEPLRLELCSFLDCVRTRSQPQVDGFAASNALKVAEAILAKIKEHSDLVSATVRQYDNTSSRNSRA